MKLKKQKTLCCSLSQDPSIHELRPFPFLPLYVVYCSKLLLQPLLNYSGVSLFHWLPGVFHPLVSFIQVSDVRMLLQYTIKITWSVSACVEASHTASFFFLSRSVILCYFIALASVYANSVALLKSQLKMASFSAIFFIINLNTSACSLIH